MFYIIGVLALLGILAVLTIVNERLSRNVIADAVARPMGGGTSDRISHVCQHDPHGTAL